MKNVRLIVLASIVSLGTILMSSQARTEETNPSHSSKQSKGFLDYALDKINPDGKDYGAAVDNIRADAVRDTVNDLYFWSNLLTLTLLSGVTGLFCFHLRSGRKKELLSAALITQLYNGRVSDRAELERRTAQYNQLVERQNAQIERTLLSQSRSQNPDDSASTKIKRNAEKLEKQNTTPVAAAERTQQSPPALPDAQQDALLFERRIEAMRNTEQNLRERLNQTTFQLEQERQRNATLKGA